VCGIPGVYLEPSLKKCIDIAGSYPVPSKFEAFACVPDQYGSIFAVTYTD